MLNVINQFVYRPDATFAPAGFTPAELGLPYEEVVVQAADRITLSGWYLPAPKASRALLYCHGNAGDIRDWVHAAPPFLENSTSVLVWDYRGYGRSEGQPSEKGLYLDGRAMWAWLQARADQDSLPAFILGKSLGSAVAIDLAARQKPAGLVLDSAFTSMREVVALHASWVPGSLIPKLFESMALAPAVTCPTLLVHGSQDMLVPLSQGERLFEALQGPKAKLVIPVAGHNDISTFSVYYEWILRFLDDPAGLGGTE